MTECLDAVKIINEDIFDLFDMKTLNRTPETLYELSLKYETISDAEAVEFLGTQIWCSENDERYYNEDKDELEPIEVFLRREIKSKLDMMQKIFKKFKHIPVEQKAVEENFTL